MTYVFEHIVVMTFPGVSKDAWPVEFDLPVVTPLSSCTVKFLESLDNHISHADQEQALREGMLKAVTYQDKDFKNLVAEIQARRPPDPPPPPPERDKPLLEGMLKAVTYQDKDFKNLVAEIQARRPPEAGYAVIPVRGPAELDMSQIHRDMVDVVVGFELAEKDNY